MAPSLKKHKKRTTYSIEWGIKNYLNKHSIYKNNSVMQTVIINSFIADCKLSNDLPWDVKLQTIENNFGKFCMYAHNNWKHGK